MDGVLTDSGPSHRLAFEQIFAPLGISDFVYSDYAGQRTVEVVRAVLVAAGIGTSPGVIAKLAATKTSLAQEHFRAVNPIADGCIQVLRNLSAAYPLALASSGSKSSVELFLQLNSLAGLFLSVLSGADVAEAKPHPEIYLRSFAALSIDPSHAAVVEDAVSGVIAAKAAGAGVIIGIAGTCPKKQLLDAGADIVLECLADLPHVLKATPA